MALKYNELLKNSISHILHTNLSSVRAIQETVTGAGIFSSNKPLQCQSSA